MQGHVKPVARAVSRQLSNTSKDADSTTSLSNLCHCSVTLPVQKCLLTLRLNLLCISLCSLSLVLSLGTARKSQAPSSLQPLQVFIYIDKILPELALLQDEQSQLSQPFLVDEMLQVLHHLAGLSPECPCLSCTGKGKVKKPVWETTKSTNQLRQQLWLFLFCFQSGERVSAVWVFVFDFSLPLCWTQLSLPSQRVSLSENFQCCVCP